MPAIVVRKSGRFGRVVHLRRTSPREKTDFHADASVGMRGSEAAWTRGLGGPLPRPAGQDASVPDCGPCSAHQQESNSQERVPRGT